ncbi:MAG: hypothetical protein J3K34DRAFT_461970 [Monoraphidium minutum]|nr:MAG: hypothetical protein J3K34DRAFT_461970 [Monoraphidium minutum]
MAHRLSGSMQLRPGVAVAASAPCRCAGAPLPPHALQVHARGAPLQRCAAAAGRHQHAVPSPLAVYRWQARRAAAVARAGRCGEQPSAAEAASKQQQQQQRGEQAAAGEEGEGEWDEGDEYEGEGDEYEDGEYEEYEEGEEGEMEEGEEEEQPAPRADKIPADVTSTPYVEGQFVEVGLITKAFGIRGEVKVAPQTDEPRKRFAKGKRLWLQPPPAPGALARAAPPPPLSRVVVESSRVVKPEARGKPGSEVWALKLREVPDRSGAERLAGLKLLLAVGDRERLRGSDEFYVQDLVGLKVYDHAGGGLIGLVTEVYDGTGTFSTLRLRLAPSREDIAGSVMRTTLLPFAAEVVPVVDVDAGRMEVSPPPGLLDLTSKKKLRRPYTPEQAARLLAMVEEDEARAAAAAGGGAPAAAGGGGAGQADEGQRREEQGGGGGRGAGQ